MRTRIIVLLLTVMLASTYTTRPGAVDKPRDTEAPPVTGTAGDYSVRTDYSGLTPYKPAHNQSRRLKPGPMPELVPSKSYGPLVPYVGARIYDEYGGWHEKYGLATLDGTLVTDAVYEYIYRYSSPNGERSVYILPDYANREYEENEGIVHLQAACAVDGSWYIPVEYEYFNLRDNVIIAVRGHAAANSDVYDYSGRLLYNVQELDCADRLADGEGYNIAYQDEGDYAAVSLTTGNTAYIYLPTGHVMYTGYEAARPFCDGLAAVCADGLWGYIDMDFNFVLEPQYQWANDFMDGRAVVGQQNGVRSSVIDKTGMELYGVEGYNEVMELYNLWDGKGYVLRSLDGGGIITYITLTFESIPANIDGYDVNYLGDGWFQYCTLVGVTLIGPDGARYGLPGINYVHSMSGGLAVTADADYHCGVMTLSGEDVIPVSKNCYYIYKPEDYDLFIATTDDGIIAYNPDGSIFAEVGDASILCPGLDLLGITDRDSFYYCDKSGRVTFSVSLLAYLPD